MLVPGSFVEEEEEIICFGLQESCERHILQRVTNWRRIDAICDLRLLGESV